MRHHRRILVGLDGLDPDEQVIRYAAMVARLSAPAPQANGQARSPCVSSLAEDRPRTSAPPPTHVAPPPHRSRPGGIPEIRFVSLLRHLGSHDPTPRAALIAALNEHFGLPEPVAVSCDLLKGRPLERLPALAHDFDADVLLVDEAADSRRKSARLAVESPCPVWLVPRDFAPVLRQILVPIDFSPRSATCLRTAIELAERFRPAKCLALHVLPNRGRLGSDTIDPARERELLDEYEAFLAGIDTGGVSVEPMFVKAGRFGGAIQRAVRDTSADLTVMIARRRSRLAGGVLRSHAETAIRAASGAFLILKSGTRPLTLGEALQERWTNADPPHFS